MPNIWENDRAGLANVAFRAGALRKTLEILVQDLEEMGESTEAHLALARDLLDATKEPARV